MTCRKEPQTRLTYHRAFSPFPILRILLNEIRCLIGPVGFQVPGRATILFSPSTRTWFLSNLSAEASSEHLTVGGNPRSSGSESGRSRRVCGHRREGGPNGSGFCQLRAALGTWHSQKTHGEAGGETEAHSGQGRFCGCIGEPGSGRWRFEARHTHPHL